MDALGSESNSDCDSGWTLYLEHSYRGSQFISGSDGIYEEHKDKRTKEEDYDEEDMSMVSDASSGPPQFPYDEAYLNEQEYNGAFYAESKVVKLAKNGKKKQKVKENQNLPCFLHDTASSCVFDFSINEVAVNNQQSSTESMQDYSQGFSSNYFKGRSTFHQHLGFIQPSLSANEYQGNEWYGEKGMRMRSR
ncbi:hypothetical protein TanjilG_30369 [Lupinus angustifolius]|uniref:uncharacterized protein LOC109335661 isoform X2 n=1 Tax=Lupinus angustifolius TaxID=3871 RepID=UPI00090CF3E9|nr:PREDICTED: uncharacterized protein LOC109335661 isoform X2 [Lupinus angustifolius]OIV91147.1 hypothetical protein TanjilG_30369 [Lupinus angustifolius]